MVAHRVVVLAQSGPMCRIWEEAGASVEAIGSRPLRAHEVAPAVRQLADGQRPSAAMVWHGVELPQIIHALNPLGIPIGIHGGNPAHGMSKWVEWKFALLELLYQPRGPLPTFICCSQYVANSFERSGYLRRFKRVVVHNGVEMPVRRTHTPREATDLRPTVIGMVGRLDWIKDHATLLSAVALVRKRYPSVELELAGNGDSALALKRLASGLGIVDSVRFLGDVSDVYGQMADWDLFAYSTTAREGLGNALAEAMMFGLPCVVTDVGPMREFAGDSQETVRLVPPASPLALADAICSLIPNVAARARLGAAGQAFAQSRFHPNVFARRYADVLQLALPDSPNSTAAFETASKL
jgi:glycosyltransferase involved in cell wall biosynthesis